MATGPGHGITMSTGRLVVGFNTFLASSKIVSETIQTGCAATRECAYYRRGQGSLSTTFTISNTEDPDDVVLTVTRNDTIDMFSHNEDGQFRVGRQLPPYVWAGDRSAVFYR